MADLSGIAKTKLSSLVLTGFFFLCSLVASHPLYFLSLIFLFPYILKILSFLSPLFITTSLLLIAFLIKDNLSAEPSPKLKKVSLLLTAYHAVLQKLQRKLGNEDEDAHSFEALQVYRMVFDASMMVDETGNRVDYSEENPEEKILQAVESSILKISQHDDETSPVKLDILIDDSQLGSIKSVIQEKRFEDFLKEADEFEFMDCCDVDEKIVQSIGTEVNKAAADKQKTQSLLVNGSEAKTGIIKRTNTDSRRQNTQKTRSHSRKRSTKTNIDDYTDNYKQEQAPKEEDPRSLENDLGRFGSSRKEKEWRRTLACKLFEEKHSANFADNSSEGMDLLWETYDSESTKKGGNNARAEMLKRSDKSRRYFEEDQEDDEEEEIDDAHLCCLQAFKISAGKMNLGVGRRNLARISKAVKGFGWLHRVSKNGKNKVYDNNSSNGDSFRFA